LAQRYIWIELGAQVDSFYSLHLPARGATNQPSLIGSSLPARAQRILEAAIQTRLEHEPTTPTKAIKRFRTNPRAQFELRAGDLRALDNVEGNEVVILIVGRKVGNKLIVEGEEFHGHQDDSVEPPRNGPQEDLE
jgi:hypothetical protein